MNILLLQADELDRSAKVWLTGRRAHHLRNVLEVVPGKKLRAGIIQRDHHERGGSLDAVVEQLEGERVLLRVDHSTLRSSPAPRVDLILALPRPKALRRTLQACAVFGVRSLQLVNAWRVSKSYFQSPFVAPDAITEQLLLGCEQGGRTWLPSWQLHHRLMDCLDALTARQQDPRCRIVAEPGQKLGLESLRPLPQPLAGSDEAAASGILAVIGPEGGFIQRELDTFERLGFRLLSLGDGILKSEMAVTALLAQLELLTRL
jgi:16S rRNA (uracil1498-N3)-methyltransferase